MAKRDNTVFEDIIEFHKKFGLEYNGPPRQLPADLQKFRSDFLDEELVEYLEAVQAGDLAKQFDSLIDLIYIALGTAYLQGFPFDDGWTRVQAANMAKMRAIKTGQSHRDGFEFDVVKPEGWLPPCLDDLVK